MFNGYILLAFLLMGLLFVRHIFVYKQKNKLNYAPIIIAIGIISSSIHFISHPEGKDFILLIRESLFPLIISLFLYIVMNILHQTQNVEHSKEQVQLTKNLISQISKLKLFSSDLQNNMCLNQKEVQSKFNQDIKSLESIQINQNKFLEKFNEMEIWHKNVSNLFNDFAETKVPDLDGIVHKHIDMLRVSEQDHFNKLKTIMDKTLENRSNIDDEVLGIKEKLESMKDMSNSISESIKEHTFQQLSGVTKAFENQILSLKSHTEGVSTSLYESENRLKNIKEQSVVIIEQMLLSSKKLESLGTQSDRLYDTYLIMKELISDVEMIKTNYENAKSEFIVVSQELKASDDRQILDMKEQVDLLSGEFSKKIDESLDKLHKHYHMATNEIPDSVQLLSKKTKLKGYEELVDS
ncbi:MAG: hypothetical protein U9N02_00895 [Campylobacterota bacterium]|nr:hypothetical protein [Campylobacterota bacterium]